MKEKYISIEEYGNLIKNLAEKLEHNNIKSIYGVPKNGSIIATSLEQYGFKIETSPDKADAIVDDLIDSGRTRKKYSEKPFYILVEKKDNIWINFWFEKDSTEDAESLIVRQFEKIGENPNRPGLLDTPRRVVKMWKEIFRGYDPEQKPKVTTFMNGEDNLTYDQMVIDEGDFYSHCEHHMVPFFGKYWFSYIPHPKGKILGLSKVARVVDYYSSKLQIQERLVQDIVNHLWEALCEGVEHPPLGMALVMQGEHLCKTMRGVKKKGKMTSSELRGKFKENVVRMEFLKFIDD